MTVEEEVCQAAMNFYDGINEMVSGGSLDKLKSAWEHGDKVTAGHPSGEWSQGWAEILVGFELFGALGRPDRGGSKVRGMKAYVFGDIAYTICLFTTSPAFGGETLACTNVLRRSNGAWKIIHHHADKAPALGAAAEKFAREG